MTSPNFPQGQIIGPVDLVGAQDLREGDGAVHFVPDLRGPGGGLGAPAGTLVNIAWVVFDLLAKMWGESPEVSELARAMFETAVIEIAANIVRHGSDEGQTLCNLILKVYPNRLDAHFRDDGLIADVNIAAAMPDALAESGRGLAMAKAAVDVLTYERHNEANYWTLRRTRTVD